MVIRRLLTIAIYLLGITNAFGKYSSPETFQIMTEIMDPFQVMQRGKLKGSNVEFVRQVFSNAQVKLPRIDIYPWPRAFQTAQLEGNRFIFPMVRTADREALFEWVGKIAESDFYLYGRKNNKLELNNLEDVKHLQVALMKNDVAYNYFKQKGFESGKNLLVMSDRETIEKLFFNERLPIIISSPFLIQEQAKLHGKNPAEYEQKYFLKDLTVDFYLAASLTTDQNLIERLKQSWPDSILKH